MRAEKSPGLIMRMPLFLIVWGAASLAMYVPAIYGLVRDNNFGSRTFFYAGTMGLVLVTLIGLAVGSRPSRYSASGQLLSLFAAFAVLPLFLAMPFHHVLGTTTFLNAYFDMVSSVTTTGANLYTDPARLPPVLHLWRAEVAWLGGFLMWVAASAILAPLSLGGFEVTQQGQPGRSVAAPQQSLRADPRYRVLRIAKTLAPIYLGLTIAVWVLLLTAGERSLTALCHAMSVMATSGISPVGGVPEAQSGFQGEAILFLFMFFALSRLTFSSDTVVRGYARLDKDPEFRIGLLIILAVPTVLFARHWIGALDADAAEDADLALQALWGSIFTVTSFLTTTGFESADWANAQMWSGLGTPGLILMGLAMIGGGVATTAGGVKLLRVYALYLNGLRELERLIYPSSVYAEGTEKSRIQRDGAFIAWIFFMLFALSLAFVATVLSALGVTFEHALVLAIATLSTTGPLIETAAETPIRLIELNAAAKGVLCATMILGRLETLAIVALLTPDLWRS